MKAYTATRWSEGNKLFPPTISIGDNGLTIHVPALFSGKETTIPYNKISAVKINCPFIGYSDIIIDTAGEDSFTIHGFTADEVREMKEEILKLIQ